MNGEKGSPTWREYELLREEFRECEREAGRRVDELDRHGTRSEHVLAAKVDELRRDIAEIRAGIEQAKRDAVAAKETADKARSERFSRRIAVIGAIFGAMGVAVAALTLMVSMLQAKGH